MSKGTITLGHIARGEGQGASRHAGEGSLWVWTEKQLRMAGLGFHFLLRSPGASLTGTDSWGLKVFYLNKVLSHQAVARLVWLNKTKPIYYYYVRAERPEKEKTSLSSSTPLWMCLLVLVLYSLCAVIYRGLWEGVFGFCFVLFWWRWRVA